VKAVNVLIDCDMRSQLSLADACIDGLSSSTNRNTGVARIIDKISIRLRYLSSEVIFLFRPQASKMHSTPHSIVIHLISPKY